MGKNLNKETIILLSIATISLISATFLGIQLAIILFLVLFLVYLIITKKHYIKVFKGMNAYKLEDYTTALEFYRDAAMSTWANGVIITNYLICELKYGKPSIAKEYVNENLKTKSIKPHEILNLEVTKAIVNWKTSSKEEAITSLKNLLASNKNTYIYETLTSLLLGSKKFDEAKKYFDTLIDENVRFIEPYYYTALIEGKNGNFEKSIDLLRKAQGLNESLVSLISQVDVEQALNSIMIKSLNSI